MLTFVIPNSALDQVTLVEPFKDFPVSPIVIVLEVPQIEVVILALPSKEVPFINLAVCKVVAVLALASKSPSKGW